MAIKRFLFLSLGVLLICSCSSEDVQEGILEYAGHKYKTVIINGQEVMAENLNYDVPGSKCYDNNPANCEKYGRLYSWIMAMNLPNVCTSFSCPELVTDPHKGICPSGWHIPTNVEWDKLYHYADGTNWTDSPFYRPYNSPTAGRYLKAKTGWKHCGPSRSSSSMSSSSMSSSSVSSSSMSSGSMSSGSSSSSSSPSSSSFYSSSSYDDKPYLCDDTFGFAALPGGNGSPDRGEFGELGEVGLWWSASEVDEDTTAIATAAYGRFIYNRYESASWSFKIKTYFFSVRCFKD